MSITQRRYKILVDFSAVHQFLTDTYDFETLNSYLLPQYFEYAHHLQWFDYIRAHRMGLWEDDGELIAVACYEMPIGMVHLHTKPEYDFLLPEMLEWSEKEISSFDNGKHCLNVWITDKETQKQALLKQNGYHLEHSEPVKISRYENAFMDLKLLKGYHIIDGTNVDYEKLTECFWCGFHNDEMPPPYAKVDSNKNFMHAPHADKSLMTVVVCPSQAKLQHESEKSSNFFVTISFLDRRQTAVIGMRSGMIVSNTDKIINYSI